MVVEVRERSRSTFVPVVVFFFCFCFVLRRPFLYDLDEAYQNNVKMALRLHSGNNVAVDENLNESGEELS